jgi:hypothetical protein
MTAEEWADLPEAKSFELVDGVIHPNVRTVTLDGRGRPNRTILEESDEITAEPALAEFRCQVSAFFTGLDGLPS